MGFLPADILENFHFLRPMLLLALIPAALLFTLLRFLQGTQSNWTRAIDPRLLPYLLDKRSTPAQSWPMYGLFALWSLCILALAGPVWQQIPVPVQEREDALVIVLDMSLSMYATDLNPNRATRAQRKIVDILNLRREEGETGLVVYAGSAHAVTPMTDDVETIKNLVPSLQPNIMPVLGSKPVEGIKLAIDLLANSALAEAHILLLTDGITASDLGAIDGVLAGSGHRLSVLGFGTEEGSPIPMGQDGYLRDENNAIVIPRLDRDPLQRLASQSGGRYADAQLTDDDIHYLLDEDALADTENLVAVDDREFDTWDEAGPWLLLLVLPFAAMAFRKGWLLVLPLALVLVPDHSAYAWEWQDLWKRSDQQGSQSFTEENYGDAASRFEDPAWRAAANYRNENYEAAVGDLSLLNDPEANYNRGNALARLMQYEAAIAAYDQTLAQVPDHADALHNREIVEKLLEQQQQDQQNSQGDQQQEEQNGEQNQDQQQQQQSQDQQQQQQSDQQQQGEQEQQEQQDQQQQDQEQQEQDSQENEEQQEQEQEQQELSENQQADPEEEQAMQQWLMRIPDDPGELLRNKFRYQSQQRLFEQLQNPGQNAQASEQIW
jgi:Ca-activated chloride channel family protein